MKIGRRLLAWYDRNKRRQLPWRNDPTPYHVWVSEIMLQQTRVETVMGYYNRFMEALPTVEDLAGVDEDNLLKLWEGLGYYSRAIHLKEGAVKVVADFNGRIPSKKEDLLSLPGIGPYTAGAILSIAYGQAEVAADGNAYRIAARLLAEEGELEKLPTRRRLESFLLEQLTADRPGDFNQALMDLGSMVCLSHGSPLCSSCPLQADCLAEKKGNPAAYPRRKPKRKQKLEKKTVLFIEKGDCVLLEKRGKEGLLSGLWGLPVLEGWLTEEEVREALPFTAFQLKRGIQARHVFSHRIWEMQSYYIELAGGGGGYLAEGQAAEDYPGGRGGDERVWASPEDLKERYPLPSAFRYFFVEET